MNVLLIGSGGREHALAWKISQSKLLHRLYIAPGNPGTAQHGINLEGNILDFEYLKNEIIHRNITMVVVGPEEPLVKGLTDYLREDERTRPLTIIGPCAKGAMLEGSKDFSKQFMLRHGIPTAAYKTFHSGESKEAIAFLDGLKPPFVLKADGLAAGKGVVITHNKEEAGKEITDMLENRKFGQASSRIVIEEYLHGIELSVFVLANGRQYVVLPEAKDYKRIGEQDTGLNTGGMGAVSPVPFAGSDFMQKVHERVIRPTIHGLMKDEIPYCGFIFIGLMNCEGNPYVIEYNCRMGDPETEVVIPRMDNDLLELFQATGNGTLQQEMVTVSTHTAATVMMVSGGYPGNYEKGFEISGTDNIHESMVFHAGTALKDGKLVNNGGRVLAVTSLDSDLKKAFARSYRSAKNIRFHNQYYRKDLGKDLVSYL